MLSITKNSFRNEVESRLRRLISASKEGYRSTPTERHRLEGFMDAGIFLKLATKDELRELRDEIYREIFGSSIQTRTNAVSNWRSSGELIDYDALDAPTFNRPFRSSR